MRLLVDSSGWIEYFSGGPLAERYGSYLGRPAELITPTIVVYEVYKKIKRERGEELALRVTASLTATEVIPLTESIALLAADVSLQYGLAMADAIIYATARDQEARVLTSNADLKDLPEVVYLN